MACASLNRLSAKTADMGVICDLWEDIQFYFGFEGLVVWCRGKSNRWADVASRYEPDAVELGFDLCYEDTRRSKHPYLKIGVQWTRGDLSCAVEDVLMSLQ